MHDFKLMTERRDYLARIEQALKRNPIVALLGARQVGKTTLARQFVRSDSARYFDLEDPAVATLMENPMTALEPMTGLVVIVKGSVLVNVNSSTSTSSEPRSADSSVRFHRY